MRVLHLSAGNLYGGVETLLVTLSRQRVLCADMQPSFALCFPGRLADELTQAGTPPAFLALPGRAGPGRSGAARGRLRQLLCQERFAAVLCHGGWPHALFAPVVRAAGVPLVFWCHDVPTGRHWVERWAARTPPDQVIANSRYTRAALGAPFPSVPTEVIYPPVAAPGKDCQARRQAIRTALETPHDAVVIVQSSRLERWKGHSLLLETLGILQGVAGWRCWIAGGAQRPHEKTYLRELQSQTAQLGLAGRVRFLGERSDIPQVLAAADIHCQPNSGPEPFGIAFIEALDAGLPVVTTALGAAREIVDESCGLLVPARDAVRLASALRHLISAPARRKTSPPAGLGERGICVVLAVNWASCIRP